MGERKEYNYQNPRLPAFYERFKMLTDKAGGVTKVSEITGISRPTIQFWYNGQRTPDAENLIVLSRQFGVSADWLLGIADEGNATNDALSRKVSEYVGLSNKAVKTLHDMFAERDVIRGVKRKPGQYETGIRKVIELLITSKTGQAILNAMHTFLYVRFNGFASTDGNGTERKKTVWLCNNESPQYELMIDGIEEVFALTVQNRLHDLKREISEREGK